MDEDVLGLRVSISTGRRTVDLGDRSAMEGPAGTLPALPDLPPSISAVGAGWNATQDGRRTTEIQMSLESGATLCLATELP